MDLYIVEFDLIIASCFGNSICNGFVGDRGSHTIYIIDAYEILVPFGTLI